MKQSKLLMGMPASIEIVNCEDETVFSDIYTFLKGVDQRFSTYKASSEISHLNSGLPVSLWSNDLKLILYLSSQTRRQTKGYFDIDRGGQIDPSGLVKGWAIQMAADRLRNRGYKDFYIDIGGDVQANGVNTASKPWKIGVRNPFKRNEIVKVVRLSNQGIATSGSYIRGQHIYDPHDRSKSLTEIVSLSVIGPNIYEADRFATAAYAIGREGIQFIEELPGLEGYMIDNQKRATLTTGFKEYLE